MAHVGAEQGATVYIDEGFATPEDTFTLDGWPTTVRFVGPGLTVEIIDSDA